MDRMSVFIKPGSCWGRIVGEDSGSGACDLCVQICPAVFEKPTPGRCARVRTRADVAGHAEQILRAVQGCPVDAIRVTTLEARETRGAGLQMGAGCRRGALHGVRVVRGGVRALLP